MRGFFREFAHFLGNHGKAEAMLAGARRFDRRVEREQVGLFGEVVDHLDDLADVVGAAAEHVDNFSRRLNGVAGAVESLGGFVHRGHAGAGFFARAMGDIDEQLGGVGDALDGSDHLIDGSRSFGNARGLHLRVLHDVLHVDAHLVHRAGDFVDGRGGLHADLGRFVGSARHLSRAAGDLRSAVAHLADQLAQALRHPRECLSHGVLLRARLDGHGQLAFGNRRGNGGHFFQMDDHFVEIFGEEPDFVVAMNVDGLIEIARIADSVRHFDQVIQRIFDGFRRVEGDEASEHDSAIRVPTVVTMVLISSVADDEDALESSWALSHGRGWPRRESLVDLLIQEAGSCCR